VEEAAAVAAAVLERPEGSGKAKVTGVAMGQDSVTARAAPTASQREAG